MREVAAEIIIIVLLVLANGFQAMAEIAIVSVRKARFRRLAELDKVIIQRWPPPTAPTNPPNVR